MPDWKFSRTSLGKLERVHPDLVRIAHFALSVSPVDFGITCGHRTAEEQERLMAAGKSKTRRSKHLRDPAEAVDVVAWKDGRINWGEGEDFDLYCQIADAFGQAANDACDRPVEIRWGGAWASVGMDRTARECRDGYLKWAAENNRKPFTDAVHFEMVTGK